MHVTAHALAQFRARIAPGLSAAVAARVIRYGLAHHARAPVPSAHGAGVYIRVRGPVHFRAIVVGDAVVTILPSGGADRSQAGARRQRQRRDARRSASRIGATQK